MQFQCTCNFDIKGVMDQVLNAWLNALGILMKNKYIMYVNLIIRIINALADVLRYEIRINHHNHS